MPIFTGHPNPLMNKLGILPSRASAFIAPYVDLSFMMNCDPDNYGCGGGGRSGGCCGPKKGCGQCPSDEEVNDGGVDLAFGARDDCATEVVVTLEPKKQPYWKTLLNCGFKPMLNCPAPPWYLNATEQQVRQPPPCPYYPNRFMQAYLPHCLPNGPRHHNQGYPYPYPSQSYSSGYQSQPHGSQSYSYMYSRAPDSYYGGSGQHGGNHHGDHNHHHVEEVSSGKYEYYDYSSKSGKTKSSDESVSLFQSSRSQSSDAKP